MRTTFTEAPVPWRPGYGLPRRWRTTLERDDLPYVIELEFQVDAGPKCLAVRFAAKDPRRPIAPSKLRNIRLGECIEVAISSAAMRMERRPGEFVFRHGGDTDVTEQRQLARPPDQRTSDAHLQRVAEVYQAAAEKPTQAVQDEWPVSYSTAARWVMLARQRGFLPPHRKGD